MTLVPLFVTITSFVVGISVLRAAEARRLRSELAGYRLTFPRGLEAEAVRSMLGGISGTLLPWWRRWLTVPYVSIETHSSRSGISHWLVVPGPWSTTVENLMRASIPSVRYERAETPFSVLTVGAEYSLNTHFRALRSDPTGTNAKLLASLQPLDGDDEIVVQWLVAAHGPVAPVKVQTNARFDPIWGPPSTDPIDAEAVTAKRAKYQWPLLLAVPRIGVASDSPARARQLLRRVEVAWHETRAPGVHLRRRLISPAAIAKRMIERRAPLFAWPTTLNSEELSGLIGWPIDGVAISGLALGGSRHVAPSPVIPTTGTVIADSSFGGASRELALSLDGRLRHLHVVGPTGVGKSSLLVNMAVQDLEAGRPLVLLDPKGDLVKSVLARIPDHRRDDVLVLDPADSDRPVGLNPLQSIDRDHAEVVVENLVGLFKSLYRQSWGPRLDDILRATLLTLAAVPGATLCEVPLILTDAAYRRRIVGNLDDPIGLEAFWGWYESLSEPERQVATAPVLNKVRSFTLRPRVRGIIGQSTPSLNLRQIIDERKVLLVSLATGLLGDEAASLLGALIVAELWNATLARAGHPAESRIPAMAYLDEWQHFLYLPTPMGEVLAEARGLGLGMVLAHQHMGQLPKELREAVLADARSRVVFQVAADDARVLAREFGGILTADDLQGLGAYEVALQLYAGGATQPVTTGRTRPPVSPTANAGDIRRLSRERHGVDRSEVEAQIRARQSNHSTAPIGRRSRGDHT